MMNTQDFLNYAQETSNKDAANLLLLCGYDGVEMDMLAYDLLMKYFEDNMEEENND